MTSEPTLVPNPFFDVATVTYLEGQAEIPAPRTVVCKVCEKEIYNVAAKDFAVQWLLIPEHFETHGIKVVMG